jgi:hypothetical protein
MTPGCRSVRNFLTAFRASGSNDRCELISNVNTVTLLPSSYTVNIDTRRGIGEGTRFVPSQMDHRPSRSTFLEFLGSKLKGNAVADLFQIEAARLRKSIDFGVLC